MPSKKTKAPNVGKYVAYIVSGEGTDAEIAARCADAIPDWSDLSDKVRAEIVRLMRAFWERTPAPAYEVTPIETGGRSIAPPDGVNVTLHTLRSVEVFGSSSPAFVNERVADLLRHFAKGDSSSKVSAAVAFVSGVNAKDTAQSSLAVQMAATHDAAMTALDKLNRAECIEHAQTFGNIASKLLNAYTRQAEVLAKLQRGGEQVIKHVHIDNRGGQAVVTDHVITGGSHGETGHQPYGPHSTPSVIAALPGANPLGNGVPITSDQGQEAMPAAWGSVARRAAR